MASVVAEGIDDDPEEKEEHTLSCEDEEEHAGRRVERRKLVGSGIWRVLESPEV